MIVRQDVRNDSTRNLAFNGDPMEDVMNTSVTVATITRGRPSLLRRAITSVRKQTHTDLSHLIVVDGCETTREDLSANPSGTCIVYHYIERRPYEKSGPSRLASLRNLAVHLSTSRWIAFLDDDNEYEPDHIESLVQCALATGFQAVHSQRLLLKPNGEPYLEHSAPWGRDQEARDRVYQLLCDEGIMTPGSNIMRDRVLPTPKQSSGGVSVVDSSEWLIERQTLLECPFETEYDDEDWLAVRTEDAKLLHALARGGVRIGTTGKPTLKYYLGGFSNFGSRALSKGEWV